MTAEEKAKGEFNMKQVDVDRVQEFRKCIECFLCQDVCHVLRDHGKATHPQNEGGFYGPRFTIRIASLEMHPADAADRVPLLKGEAGVGFCNITKCCTEVCPEHIKITDNGIIPMKERVADRYYDPVKILWRKATGGDRK
jgi:succinate dehydrogenase / fumarate reductase iron-sulfur subunit